LPFVFTNEQYYPPPTTSTIDHSEQLK